MKTSISSKGQLVLPAEIRRQDNIQPGQEFDIRRVKPGEYRLKRKSPPRNAGLVKLLLSCPVKDWFKPQRALGESTESIQPSKFE
ncbi:MAG: AbrB/MazE/SpoVT family DNA-binding domain-containing protein [Candidatus Hydrogenedentes bacterium]|nr:AbrB/MazE/SpoVT family DNA-binding domain-containing protein [Candidatus Hydrogenedentota bacterium]